MTLVPNDPDPAFDSERDPVPPPPTPAMLSQRLRLAAENLRSDKTTIAELMAAPGDSALPVILVFLAIPALTPSMGIPFASIFSLAMFPLGLAMLMNVQHMHLPKWLTRQEIARTHAEALLNWFAKVFAFAEKYMRPRLSGLTGATAQRWLSVNIFLQATIILAPIPFGNHAPALALLVMALALTAKDGLAVLISIVFSLISLLISFFLVGGAIWAVINAYRFTLG